eukprot:UN07091
MGNSNCCGADRSKTAQMRRRKKKRYIIKKNHAINRKSSSSINIKVLQPSTTQIQKVEDNLKSDNLTEDEKNITMHRVDRLSLVEIDNAAEIRRIVTQQYNEYMYMDMDSDEYVESDISELSSAGKPQNELLKLIDDKSKKSNLTPKTMVLWDNNELLNMENEMQQQLQHLTINNYKQEEPESSLFRFKSLDKWDEDHVKTQQFAMQEQMVHLIQTNTQRTHSQLQI